MESVPTRGWVSSPNERGTLDIITPCLLTIFLCTWTAQHLNLPDQAAHWIHQGFRKFMYMLLTIMIPEILVLYAYNELIAARIHQKIAKYNHISMTVRQGFFVNMGGLIVEDGTAQDESPSRYIVHDDHFFALVKAGGLFDISWIPEKEIEDRSKANQFVKAFTVIQILWLIIQLAGRQDQKLPITQLEVITCVFVVCTVTSYGLWWQKPVDVERAVIVSATPALSAWIRKRGLESTTTKPFLHVFANISTNENAATWITFGFPAFGALVGALHCASWNSQFPSNAERLTWHIASIICVASPVIVSLTFWIKSKFTLYLTWIIVCPLYAFARVALIVLSLIAFRKMDAGAFKSVEWSDYLPHLG